MISVISETIKFAKVIFKRVFLWRTTPTGNFS